MDREEATRLEASDMEGGEEETVKLTRAKAGRGTRGSSSNMNKTEEQHEKERQGCV